MITITEILGIVHEAEQRRRLRSRSKITTGCGAFGQNKASVVGQSFYGKGAEKRLHDECVRQAARLTELLEKRQQNFDSAIRNLASVPLGSEILVSLLRASPPKPVSDAAPVLQTPVPLSFGSP